MMAVLFGSSVIERALPPSVIGPKGGPRSVTTPSFRSGGVPIGAKVLLCISVSHTPLLTHARGRPSALFFRPLVPQALALAPPSLPSAPVAIASPVFKEPPVALASVTPPPVGFALPALPPVAFALPASPFGMAPPAPVMAAPPAPVLGPLELVAFGSVPLLEAQFRSQQVKASPMDRIPRVLSPAKRAPVAPAVNLG